MAFAFLGRMAAVTITAEPAPVASVRAATFQYDGFRLAYTEYGSGDRVVVLLHGLLMTRTLHEPLARTLAGQGFRAVTLDLLGHGDSDRPGEAWRYSMSDWGLQVVALLDELGVARAAIVGTSLGANVALEVADAAPERLTGIVVEMPVLDSALLAAACAFLPLLVLSRFLPGVISAGRAVARTVPEQGLPHLARVVLDTMQQRPAPMSAVLSGIFFGRAAPPKKRRLAIRTRTLIVGHRHDPIHPFADAGMLADELPNATVLQARSILEMQTSPERLTREIAGFLAGCWPGPARTRRTSRSANGVQRPAR